MGILIEGRVIRGTGYGKKLGFPTANLDRKQYAKEGLRVPLGIYAGMAYRYDRKETFKAAIVVGPVDKKKLPKIEAHLLDFSGTLYGKNLLLCLSVFLRPFKTFASEKLLIAQIKKDVKKVEKEVAAPMSL